MSTKIILNVYYFSFCVWMLSLMFLLIQMTVIFGLTVNA